ncbi:DUF6895 family protein [Streptomyces sp. M41]|uniref:DUF6895 family protein n=1 Tax=Streptomyces sp. M41 TaxID=3059412 RepID=UPI00374CAB35
MNTDTTAYTTQPLIAAVSELENAATTWLCRELSKCSVTLVGPGPGGMKPLVDIALYASVRARLRPVDPVQDEILQHLRQEVERPAYRDLVVENGDFVNYYGLPYAAVVAMGEDGSVGRLVRAIVRSGVPLWTERPPHRILDVLFFLRLLGMSVDSRPDEVLPFSSLASNPNVLLVTEQETYAMTHTAMYATEFGQRRAVWPELALPDVRDLLDVLLERAVESGSVDLAAELVCSAICVCDARGLVDLAPFLELLASTRREDGSWPRYAAERSVPENWPRSHHATLVVALALAMVRRALEPGPYPARQVGSAGREAHRARVRREVDAVLTRGTAARSGARRESGGRACAERPLGDALSWVRPGRGALWRVPGADRHGWITALEECVFRGEVGRREVCDGILLLASWQDEDGLIRCCDDEQHHAGSTASAVRILTAARRQLAAP